MKTYRNLYPQLCSYENLELAFIKARKGKTQKEYVIEFEAGLERNLLQLKHELETCTYAPRPPTIFIIKDPKTRKIGASHFRDRVVHHAVCNILEPIFEKRFIHDSFANRKEKGTHAAIKRFEKFVRRVSRNGKTISSRAKNRNAIAGYALKADIRRYFDTVDHRILIQILRGRIRDERLLRLVQIILSHHKTNVPGKGMPLGNLTSQFFANVYLNELDYFIKHKLRAKCYLRYVDDFILLHRSRRALAAWKKEISAFLNNKLGLELHPEKSRIIPLCRGITLLGFRVFFCFRLLKKSNARRIWKRLGRFGRQLRLGRMQIAEAIQSLNGWLAYAAFANTHNLRQNIIAKFNELARHPVYG